MVVTEYIASITKAKEPHNGRQFACATNQGVDPNQILPIHVTDTVEAREVPARYRKMQ